MHIIGRQNFSIGPDGVGFLADAMQSMVPGDDFEYLSSGARVVHVPPDAADLQTPVLEVPMASFAKLMHVRDMQKQAAAQRAEQDELRRLREELREKNRLRGATLRSQRQQQQQQIVAVREKMQREHRGDVDARKHDLENEKSTRAAAQKRYEEHARQLTKHEKEQMAKSRDAVEQARLKREAETMHMRTGLKELKEAIDDANLAALRKQVQRVRADTSDEKIRRAKSQCINARWDEADALRQELNKFKATRRDQELLYLSTAMQLNLTERAARPDAEVARRRTQEQAVLEATEVRRRSEEAEQRRREEKEHWESRQRAVHEAMQGPRVALRDDTLDTSDSLLNLFSRMFGFNRQRHVKQHRSEGMNEWPEHEHGVVRL